MYHNEKCTCNGCTKSDYEFKRGLWQTPSGEYQEYGRLTYDLNGYNLVITKWAKNTSIEREYDQYYNTDSKNGIHTRKVRLAQVANNRNFGQALEFALTKLGKIDHYWDILKVWND